MEPSGEPGSLARVWQIRGRAWWVTSAAVFALAACATSRGVRPAPRVFNLQPAPPRTVPAGCPITLSFLAESQAGLVKATVTWRVTQITPRGPVIVERWYAVLAIAEHVTQPRTYGVVALQLRPRLEGRYDYTVEVEDSSGLTSNALYKTVTVEMRSANMACPPADPVLPRPSALAGSPLEA
jgi:hypothetical protein